MDDLHLAVALFLLLNILLGLVRIMRGPTPADRMLSTQLFGTTGVAILLLLSVGLNLPVLLDVAIVFALLGALATVAFVKRYWPMRFEGNRKKWN